MKRQAITILGIIMMAGAIAMYSGESINFETELTNPVYTVLDNSSSLEGLSVDFENGNITISTELNYKSDNFTLVFFDNITREVTKTINTRGRSRTEIKYIDKNVTVYVPEYINTTEYVNVIQEVEVEKIVDNTIIIEENKLWTILLGLVIGIIFGYVVIHKRYSKDREDKRK